MKKYIRKPVIIGALLIGAVGAFALFSSPGKASVRVEKRTLTQDIVTQGTIEATHKVDLVFETEGSVKEIMVKPGDSVAFGAALAVLDTRALDAQKNHLETLVALDKAKFMQLLAGVSKEEIILAQAKVDASHTAVDAAQRAFQDSQLKTDTETAALYAKAAEYSNTVVLNADNAMKALGSIYDDKNQFRDFLNIPDSKEKTDAQWQMIFARTAFGNIQAKADGLKKDMSYDAVDTALTDFKTNLEVIRSLLGKTAGILDTAVILTGSADIATYRTTIAVERSVLNETQSALIDKEQEIASQKASAQAAVASAKSAMQQAEASLKLAEDEFAVKASSSASAARALQEAQIKEDESSLAVIKQKIGDAALNAPADGIVQSMDIARGGFIKAHIPVAAFIPLADLQIQAELDPNQASLVKAGDHAVISSGTLQAKGMVAGVQGSRATVYFQNAGDAWHLQNEAEVRIISTLKKDALMVPQDFVRESDGVKKLMVIEKGEKKERIVLTGMALGNDIEITEGVSEGEVLAR